MTTWTKEQYENQYLLGRCEEVLKNIPDNTYSSCASDTPYGMSKITDIHAYLKAWLEDGDHEKYVTGSGFNGQHWDFSVPSPKIFKEVFRVMKPGAYGLFFASARTIDVMSISLRLAGFEIKDTIMWLYSSGMPKGRNIDKAIDSELGVEREVLSTVKGNKLNSGIVSVGRKSIETEIKITKATSPLAKEFEGFNTELAPSYEPAILVMKPLSEKTFAKNAIKHGTGGMNIKESQIKVPIKGTDEFYPDGFHPKNVIMSCDCDLPNDEHMLSCPAGIINKQGGYTYSKRRDDNVKSNVDVRKGTDRVHVHSSKQLFSLSTYEGEGYASRVFYVSKPSQKEKHAGLKDQFFINEFVTNEELISILTITGDLEALSNEAWKEIIFTPDDVKKLPKDLQSKMSSGNLHSTVKPKEIMKYLIRLVTPRNGICLDPFCGSGTTGLACEELGYKFTCIDMIPRHIKIAQARSKAIVPTLF